MPSDRLRSLNARAVRAEGDFVLYWVTSARRAQHNFALDHALAAARELTRPLVVFEALRCDHRWASTRFHTFVLEGMRDNAAAFAEAPGVTYVPYLEPAHGAGQGLLQALAERACLVVGDDFPCFFLPRMQAAAAERLPCPLVVVDSNGLYPLRAADREFTRAHSFRRHLHKELLPHLASAPAAEPLRGLELPPAPELPELEGAWRPTDLEAVDLARFPIDQAVASASHVVAGGAQAARARMRAFLEGDLARYADGRNHPDDDASSGFSPYLHWGHLSAHEVFWELAEREGWTPGEVAPKPTGSREGWWGMSPAAESFLDELITWRELGYQTCARSDDYDSYSSLPEWARASLAAHQDDPREAIYSLETLAAAQTADPLWNAAQRQLATDGRMHNYLRMLWGKKVLQWTRTPQEAFEALVELNNRYALDGRNPNSYAGISWVFGRYDRAWGPERPIFGKVRYMTSDSTRRKLRLKGYLQRWSGA